jgi:hypothetical protein
MVDHEAHALKALVRFPPPPMHKECTRNVMHKLYTIPYVYIVRKCISINNDVTYNKAYWHALRAHIIVT